MHVCVLGAGIVGLATAWQLSGAGHQVTVLERAAAPGTGTSAGNGAQLSYSYVQPLADPGLWKQLPALLLSRDSPLKLRPRLDPQQWRWALAFLAACNARTSRDTTAQLLALAAESRAAFEQMRQALGPDCDYAAAGKLVLYGSDAALSGARRQLELQRTLGSAPQQLLTPQECLAVEPALAGYRAQIAGAVYTPSECVADCLQLCQALTEALRARGVRFLLRTAAQGFVLRQGEAAAVRIGSGARGDGDELAAEAFVLALGDASPRLARTLGVYLPVYPIKGYSITMEVNPAPGAAPRVSVTDSTRKTVFARLGSRLRVAGMAELVGYDGRVDRARIEALAAATRALFPQAPLTAPAGQPVELHPWAGLRPATPRGLPIIGRLPGAPGNVLFNTGHGALGFTLAFGSALRLARLLPPA